MGNVPPGGVRYCSLASMSYGRFRPPFFWITLTRCYRWSFQSPLLFSWKEGPKGLATHASFRVLTNFIPHFRTALAAYLSPPGLPKVERLHSLSTLGVLYGTQRPTNSGYFPTGLPGALTRWLFSRQYVVVRNFCSLSTSNRSLCQPPAALPCPKKGGRHQQRNLEGLKHLCKRWVRLD
jgi:hypothetical protein